jgi:hypothetical protein
MSKQDNFFTKVKIDDKDLKITAVNIFGNDLIVGDITGGLYNFRIKDKQKLTLVNKVTLKSKIEKILILSHINTAFVLSGGEVSTYILPNLGSKNALIKDKNIADIYINDDDKEYSNHLLTISKKKKLKIFEYDSNQAIFTEKKEKETLSVQELPTCALWTEKNNFIYSIGNKTFWLDLNKGQAISDDFDRPVQIMNLGGKIAISNSEMTLFMKDGKTFQFNPITHVMFSPDFIGFSTFKNHLVALYKGSLHIFKQGTQEYEHVEQLEFGADGIGKFLVTSENKVIVFTEFNGKFNVLDFQERPYEEQIQVLIDQKEFNNGLQKLIENIPEDDPDKFKKIEYFFLDCAFACIEGNKKDYDMAKKYISLTDFNPFEFIYMFAEFLNINIIHSDKKQDIIDNKKENQLLGFSPSKDDIKNALTFLIDILIMKREFILNKFKSGSAEYLKQKIDFMSSKRGKINLKDSTTTITVSNTFDSINAALIKSMIKLDKNPKDIESVLDNESISFSIFKDFETDQFFIDENNKNLDNTKFTLAYIAEKKGDYETALREWENFNNNKPQGDKFANIGRERTKKIFYKFKENKSTERDKKETFLRKYIPWLLKKCPNEAFEVILKTELISNKVFMEELIPDVENQNKIEPGTLKEKFLEYCNDNQQSENYQTQLLQLYADKLFKLKPKNEVVNEFTDEIKKYHDALMKIIKNPKSCYNKRAILEYIEESWLKEPKKYLYSQLKEHDKALNELFKNARSNLKFDEIEKYCEENIESKPDIFQNFYKLLSDVVNNDCQGNIDKNNEKINELNQQMDENNTDKPYLTESERNEKIEKYKSEIQKFEELKKPYELEMLKILKNFGKIKNIDPVFALEYANDRWNVCENSEFFNYLQKMVREYTVEGNKYKIGKNLSEIGLVYKEKEAYEYKKKYVTIDSERTCDLCKKKIGNTIFVVYPNLRVYHSKCAPDHSIDPMTGVDFSKKKYVE